MPYLIVRYKENQACCDTATAVLRWQPAEIVGILDEDPQPRSSQATAYEARHFPIEPADPIEAIKFRMEQQGLAPRDLEPMIGRLNRVYEVLAGRRPLTMAMVWRLHTQLGIPAESLIRPPKLA